MKTNRFVNTKRIFSVLAIVAVLVCALCVFATADGAASLEVDKTNLKYDTYTHIIVTLNGEAPEGATKGIAVWDIDVDAPTADNVSYYNFVEESDPNGVKFFSTKGIPASELSEALYIAPAVKDADGNVALAGEAVAKSAFGYVEERLAEDELQGYQVDLYRDLVVYGTAAEQVLGDKTANKNVVVAKGGYVGNAISPLQFTTDETALLRAPVQNAKGEYFACWQDAFGNLVSGERVINVDVKAGLNYYNAVYTTAANSAYGEFANLQALSLGGMAYTVTPDDLTDGEKVGASENKLFSLFTNQSLSGSIFAAANVDVSDLTKETLPVLDHDDIIVSSSYDGVKSVHWNRHVSYDNNGSYKYMSASFVDAANSDVRTSLERFEIDLQIAASGIYPTVYVYFNEATTGAKLGTYFNISRMNNAQGESCFRFTYITEAGSVDMTIPDNSGKGFVTIAYEVDENGYCIIYINGEKLENASPVKYFTGVRAAGTFCPTTLQIEVPKVGNCDYTIYGVGIVDTDKIK